MRAWIRLVGIVGLLVGIAVGLSAQDDPNLPITEDVFYTIRPSDTLDAIGALFDMSPRCIAATNNIVRVSELKIGDELLLSVACPRYAEDPTYLPTSPVLVHRDVVRVDECAGVRASYSDTVESIARILGVAEADLRAANSLADDAEPAYQQCIVPPPVAFDGTAGSGGGGTVPAGEFYVISFGETISDIAFTKNVSLETLLIVNGIEDTKTIQAGTTIFIPADSPAYGEYPAMFHLDSEGNIAGEEYVMQPGDTLDSVAQERDVSVISLMMANQIENSRFIQAGTVIIIPEGAARYGQFPPLQRSDETLGQGGGGLQEYVVQPGDYPSKIAQEFNVDLITFMDVNGIENSYALQPGTVLVIPSDAPPFSEGIPPVSIRSASPTQETSTDTSAGGVVPVDQATDSMGGMVPADQVTDTSAGGVVPADQVFITPTPETFETIPSPVVTEEP
jgi:LysM repeat protein